MEKVVTLSDSEIEKLSISEIEELLGKYKHQKNFYNNMQLAVKIFMNSTYGALANKWFAGYLIYSAEAITKQGQHAIKFSQSIINHYFNNLFYKDKELHEKMGFKNVKKPNVVLDCVSYIDTDSCYVAFDKILPYFTQDKYNLKKANDIKQFVLDFYNYRLKEYFIKSFNIYAQKFSVENLLDFELEKISKSVIWLAKKKYVQDVIWSDGISYESLSKIMPTGVEIVQSSTPAFARKEIKNIIALLFEDNVTPQKLISYIREIKEKFKLAQIEDISFSRSIGDYEKYVINDKNKLEFASKVSIHVRGAGIHNYLVNNSKFKNKYELLKSGDKIKFYYTKEKNENLKSFAFSPGQFPIELALEIDYDIQFEKSIIDPVNRFIKVMGLPLISPELFYTQTLF